MAKKKRIDSQGRVIDQEMLERMDFLERMEMYQMMNELELLQENPSPPTEAKQEKKGGK